MKGRQRTITLEHGNGGRAMRRLIEDIFLPAFRNRHLAELADSAVLEPEAKRIAFTTDSYVITPPFFPGGDIGRLAVSGTVNDLAVCGAVPRWLSAGFIIEEGFALHDLEAIVASMKKAAGEAEAAIVTGDTKVVPRGAADGIFLNMSGVGVVAEGVRLSAAAIRPGDRVILSGALGDHAAAVMKARGDYPLEFDVASDCAPLSPMIRDVLGRTPAGAVRVMRDPTRGGLATTLVEFATAGHRSIEIDEEALPVRDAVRAICELTGFDPLYLANEGKVVIVCAEDAAQTVLDALGGHFTGRGAAIIGTVTDDPLQRVVLKTRAGGRRIIDMLVQEMLPRIC